MESIEMLMAVAMGLALAATCGLRAFLPLFAVGCLGAAGTIELAESFQWLQKPLALAALGMAVVLEIAGDKFPVVDHFLDSAGVFIKPVAATVAAASVMTDMDPMFSTILGLVVGGTMAQGVHLVKAKLRLMSSAFTATLANPIISLVEDIVAVVATVLAVFLPVLILLMTVLLAIFGYRRWRQGKLITSEGG